MRLRDLPVDVRRTFILHWLYSALGGATQGILTNAPVIGIKALGAANWHLALPTSLSGVGILMSVALGVWMARRSKMPFVSWPGFASCAACLGMAVSPHPLAFFALLGLCNLFEIVTRPAVATIIRLNYPVESRGWVTGRLRQCSAVAFLASAYGAARLLDRQGSWPFIQGLIIAAAIIQTLGFAMFAGIRVRPDTPGETDNTNLRLLIGSYVQTVSRDRRFLRYLAGCFLYAASGLAYEPLVRAFFAADLHLDYTQTVLLADVLPSLCSVLTLHRLGAWLDRTNPLRAWAAIRVGWALDPLLLCLSPLWPPATLMVAIAARTSRGLVMNGSWLLWWQLGTNFFARRREMTSVYHGVHISLNGAQRMVGPPLGAYLSSLTSRREVLAIGGILVLASAYLAWRQAEAEKVDNRHFTFAEKERLDLATS
jgi:hypothetical protein